MKIYMYPGAASKDAEEKMLRRLELHGFNRSDVQVISGMEAFQMAIDETPIEACEGRKLDRDPGRLKPIIVTFENNRGVIFLAYSNPGPLSLKITKRKWDAQDKLHRVH
jgi:hypothetical protein